MNLTSAAGRLENITFSDKAPFGYVDDAGEYQGYDVEFAKRLVEDLGVDVEWVATDPANRVPFLESNKVDIILANFTVTEERAEKVDFTLPYMKVQLGVVSPDSALVKSVDDLADKTLIVVKGTNTLSDGESAAYAKEGEEELSFDEYYTSSQLGLDGPETYVFGANTDEEGWEFVKWTKNGKDYATDPIITVELTEDSDFIAVFEYVGTEQNP